MNLHCRETRLILLSIWFCCASGQGQVFAETPDVPMRVDDALVSSAGMLLDGSPGGRMMPWCSASLTRPDAVLTAFHCLSSTHSGDVLKVFFPYEGIREVDMNRIQPFCFESDRVEKHYGPEGCSSWTDDLVVLGLKHSYSLLSPLKPAKQSTAGSGSVAAVSGFGYQDTTLSIYGVAHGGNAIISDCDPDDQGRALCFRYDTTDSGDTEIGPFDSGGPMFTVNQATGEKSLIGVALGSEPVEGTDGAVRLARYVNLTDPFYREWLAEEAFSGNFVPAAYSIETLVKDDVRELQPGKKAEFALNIGESSSRLLLTLNHDPGTSLSPNNLDLQLPDSLDEVCERHASVEVCSVENPPAGSYRISVGWGEICGADGECRDPVYDSAYQVTAIALYDKPGECLEWLSRRCLFALSSSFLFRVTMSQMSLLFKPLGLSDYR